MTIVLAVAGDLLREALARKWVLGLLIAITLGHTALASFLRLEVIDGAIAGSRLFGAIVSKDIVTAETAMRPFFMAAAGFTFFGGASFLIIACSDFAPRLLSPGRIEHLLALPVSRVQLLLGTYLGVMALAAMCTFYGALGLTTVLGFKTGTWSGALLISSSLCLMGFAAIYATMLLCAFFLPSAVTSASVGVLTLTLGILASKRAAVEQVIAAGFARDAFHVAIQPFPRLFTLASESIDIAGGAPLNGPLVLRLVTGAALFALAALAVAAYQFERKDF